MEREGVERKAQETKDAPRSTLDLLTLHARRFTLHASEGRHPMNLPQAAHEYLAAEVEGADPLRRVVLLHDGAARFIREAIVHIERRDFEGAHHAFDRAKNIVMHFLASIPASDESDLAASLRGLFKYTYRKLVEGNLRKDSQCAREALAVVRNLGEGWAELDHQRRPPRDGAPPAGAAYLV